MKNLNLKYVLFSVLLIAMPMLAEASARARGCAFETWGILAELLMLFLVINSIFLCIILFIIRPEYPIAKGASWFLNFFFIFTILFLGAVLAAVDRFNSYSNIFYLALFIIICQLVLWGFILKYFGNRSVLMLIIKADLVFIALSLVVYFLMIDPGLTNQLNECKQSPAA